MPDSPRPERGRRGWLTGHAPEDTENPADTPVSFGPHDATGPDADQDQDQDQDQDTEPDGPPPTGPRRLLIALYAIFALAATARAAVQLSTQFEQAPLAYLLSAFSGLVYLAATVGLVSRRRWSRPLAWAACGTEMVGVVVVGFLSILDAEAFPKDTVWSHFGSGYGYFPVLLPVLGLLWLAYSRDLPGSTGPTGEARDARR